jgi:hypothetical protein
MAHQKSKDEFWFDESGNKIPYSRTTKTERLMETKGAKLLREAKSLNTKLSEYKALFAEICEDVYKKFLIERDVKTERKGNFTWYNFDRSIKIETKFSESITFDELLITSAREKFNQYFSENITSKDDFAKEIVMKAFETRNGQLDPKKIFDLLRYKSKVKDELYQSAIKDTEDSIRRKVSKVYHRISERQENQEYKVIDLNFSSI